jgi:hypothetical protein
MCPMGGYLFIVLPILCKAFDGSLPVAFLKFEYLVKFKQRISNLVKSTPGGKKNRKIPQLLCQKMTKFGQRKKHWSSVYHHITYS